MPLLFAPIYIDKGNMKPISYCNHIPVDKQRQTFIKLMSDGGIDTFD